MVHLATEKWHCSGPDGNPRDPFVTSSSRNCSVTQGCAPITFLTSTPTHNGHNGHPRPIQPSHSVLLGQGPHVKIPDLGFQTTRHHFSIATKQGSMDLSSLDGASLKLLIIVGVTSNMQFYVIVSAGHWVLSSRSSWSKRSFALMGRLAPFSLWYTPGLRRSLSIYFSIPHVGDSKVMYGSPPPSARAKT